MHEEGHHLMTCLALLRLLAGSIQSVYMNLMAARPTGFTYRFTSPTALSKASGLMVI
jgi:hypothetical protein